LKNYKNKITGIIGLLISVILIILFSTIVLKLTDFAEKHISQDHQIELYAIQIIKFNLALIISFIIVLSIGVFFNLYRKLLHISSNLIDLIKFKDFFLTDDICSKKQTPVYIFIISIICGLLIDSYLFFIGEPKGEGVLEKYSSFLFFISGLVMMTSITQLSRNHFIHETKKQVVLILISISILFLYLFGEEISWGQKIFNWDSFGIFNEYNYQKETNLHNFFNPIFNLLYPMIGLGTFISLFLIWFFPNYKSYLFHLFIPHSSLFFIVFSMACSSFRGHSEIFEDLLSIFLLLYSIRIFMCLRFPNYESNKFNLS
jgi:hypothetical protein